MKKLLLSGVALTFCLAAVAQKPSSASLQSRLSATITSKTAKVIKPSDGYAAPVKATSSYASQKSSSMAVTPIGTTTYDLQANYGTPGQRIMLWNDNSISAIWTYANTFIDPPASQPERGTGYNYFDGTNWGAGPSSKIETFKTGFPALGGSDALGEVVVNHGDNTSLGAPCATSTSKISRQTKGTGAWAESPLSCASVIWWPRVAVGGSSGNTIFALGNDNVPAPGGPMNYSRSTDGGTTWVDENILLPDFATDVYEGSVDGYQVVTRGDVVAIVAGGWLESLILWKSTDNGNNWTKTFINQFPLAPYAYDAAGAITDVDLDGSADTVLTTDSGIALAIDNNNQVHVAVGLMRVLDDDGTAGAVGYSYFPGTDGLAYWNESMPANSILTNIIAAIEDDGDQIITIPDGLAIYQCSLTGMPTLGFDAQNNLHLVYSSLVEYTSNGNPDPALEEAFRNLYYMYSTDGGSTFTTPARLEPDAFAEQVWPSMAARVNGFVHLVYHQDGEPGNTYQPSADSGGNDVNDPYVTVDVMYNNMTNPVGVAEITAAELNTVVYPNPVSNVLHVDFNLEQPHDLTIQLVNVLGEVVYATEIQAVAGMNNFKLNVKEFATGVYSLNTQIGDQTFAERVVIQ